MLIHAPAVLMNITVEKFATDSKIIETMSFKNKSESSKYLYMINGVRVSLGFNIDKGEVRNYKSNKIDFDGQFTLEVTPK